MELSVIWHEVKDCVRELSVKAAEIVKIMIQGHDLHPQILGINVANFIEHVVSHVLGEDELFQIPCVFQSCLKI